MKEVPIHVMALQPTARSAGVARRFASSLLVDHDVEVREIVVLLVSEVVSNAIQHGGPHEPSATVGLALDTRPDRIRIEVTDDGTGDPIIGIDAPERCNGRGLRLVRSLASRSGCDRLSVGKTVWFEVRTDQGGDSDV
jgi:anti-sigma regulatory factor (Ser/Thr protein kinase)